MDGEVGDSQVVVNLLVTNVPVCNGSTAKTLGLQYMQFPDMGVSGGPPNGARIVHHGTDELPIDRVKTRDLIRYVPENRCSPSAVTRKWILKINYKSQN